MKHVGICRAEQYQGSWILGIAAEDLDAVIDEAGPTDRGQLYSWNWDFQPSEPEFENDIPLTRSAARSLVASWEVSWCPPEKADVAESMLFETGGWTETVSRGGRRRKWELSPLEFFDTRLLRRPIKLQTERLALTVEAIAESTSEALGELTGTAWTEAAERVLDGVFVTVPRRGVLRSLDTDLEPSSAGRLREARFGPMRTSARRNPSVLSPLRQAAQQQCGSATCLAFIPRQVTRWVNDLRPADPWNLLLRGGD